MNVVLRSGFHVDVGNAEDVDVDEVGVERSLMT